MANIEKYRDALARGWSPANAPDHDEKLRLDELAAIDRDAHAFLDLMDDVKADGPPVPLPNGVLVARIPCYRRWVYDSEDHFCGSIKFRWQKGTSALPPHVLGHIGYAIVPWERRKGYARQAVLLALDDARALGLTQVEICCRPDNIASKRTILACGGQPVGKPDEPVDRGFGFDPQLFFRVIL